MRLAQVSLTRDPGAEADVEELRIRMMSMIALFLCTVGYFTAWISLPGPEFDGSRFLTFASVMVVGAACYVLKERQPLLSRVILLFGLEISYASALRTLDVPVTSYFGVLAVMLNATISPFLGLLSAILATVSLFVFFPWEASMIPPLILLWLTAIVSWIASRGFYTALEWSANNRARADMLLNQLRERQGQLNHVLYGLTEATRRLEHTSRQLIVAQARAEEARQLKEQFAASVSHELRTPLNLIIGFAEMMIMAPESYGPVPLPSAYRGDLMTIYRSAKHLSNLIDDVLDLSQIDAGRMPLVKRVTDLRKVISDSVDIMRDLAQARGLRVELNLPVETPLVCIDETRIRQVLLNLLANATRYTDSGWIRTSAYVDDRAVRVLVEDTGCGISPSKLSAAFESFSKLDDVPSMDSSGLGLAISKKFVELHGGRMWIESEVGRGTSVGFELPRALDGVELAPVRTIGPRVGSLEQPTVIVLHEDKRVLSLLNRHIEGYRFLVAQNSTEVLAMTQQEWPNAMIIGCSPNGADAQLTAIPELAALPHIICPLPSLYRLAESLGATDFLPKPVTREMLASALEGLPNPPKTVLVVDDDVHMVRLMSRMLKSLDPTVHVLEAFRGEEGLELARIHQPDVMLLDLVMPGVSGYQVLEEIRRDEKLRKLAVIVVSVRTQKDEAAALIGNIHLVSPDGFSLTHVLRIIDALLPVITGAVAQDQATAVPHEANRSA